jgi:hypothetical protein
MKLSYIFLIMNDKAKKNEMIRYKVVITAVTSKHICMICCNSTHVGNIITPY